MRKNLVKNVAFLFIVASWLLTGASLAFDYGITYLDKAAIQQLSDEALKQTYIDVLIEVEAAKVFHIKAGFTWKDYQQFRDLIRYRVNLLFELQQRKIEIPKIEP